MHHHARPRATRVGWGWLALALAGPALATDPRTLAGDPAALTQLMQAVSLDVMTEVSLGACDDVGAPSTAAMRVAWVAWREKHQLAPLRTVIERLRDKQGTKAVPWSRLTESLRERVLKDAAPEQVCAGLARDLGGADMDVSAIFPLARPVAQALLQVKVVAPPMLPAVAAGAARGQVLQASQIEALVKQHNGGWSAIGEEAARRNLGLVYVKGRVERWSHNWERYRLVQEQGDREAEARVSLSFNAEPWVGREVVFRGVVTSLRSYGLTLSEGAIVGDPSGLAPSPLPHEPLVRKEVLLQRVLAAPGKGLAEKDLVAVVIHGESNMMNGTRWDEDVRFLLRDGTVYRRTEMPPDQVNVTASRQLEPQRWGRWRSAGKGYEMQAQDEEGRPQGDWKAVKHHAVRPWPKDSKLEGSFSRGRFDGSLALGGTSSKKAFRFTPDGRFERSYSSLSSSGTVAATLNNVNISASSYGDGKGSNSTGGGTVGGPFGTAGAVSSGSRDDGASRRGRYRLDGFAIELDYDDGRKERLLSFPVYGDSKTVYVGDGSVSLDK